jgi:molecular chaperone HtpG
VRFDLESTIFRKNNLNTFIDFCKMSTSTSTETFAFSADINQLLSLIINTFYSNKDVFLRELISNASDALDKIRYQSLTDPDVLKSEPNLEIRISFDKENKQLIIQDTGIGMTKDDMIKNLGTIAKSGTKAFMESMAAGADISMIGQFGVGFYSAYLVADHVTVISKNNTDEQYKWESTAGGSFSISLDDSSMVLKRGTAIILNLKEDMVHYLDELKTLIIRHNQFIGFPIYLQTVKTRTVELQEKVQEQEVPESETSDEVKVEDVEESAPKTTTESYNDWDIVNQEKPLWTRNPKEITTEEYNRFYKAISNDFEDSLEVSHFSVEGQLEFKGLLFVPKRAPYDLYDKKTQKQNNIKLYVRRVFITDTVDDLVPEYLSFVKGLIDSEDLPLNISRETLQQNKIMKVIKKNLVKKCLDLFSEIASDKEKFTTFYEQFSKNIKLGVHEDSTHRVKLASFLRYESSTSENELVSLDEYVERMQEGQKGIYFITGESKKSVIHSPFLERLKKKNLEVLFMVEPMDEYVTQQLREYNGKNLINITKENLNLEDDSLETLKTEYENVCSYMKTILSEDVEKVVVSTRLDTSPCVLVTSEYGWTANMQRIMKAQALGSNTQMGYMMGKKTLEINPSNPIIMMLKKKLDSGIESKTLKDLVHLLYDVTLQSSGFTLEDPSMFSNRILKLIQLGMGVEEEEEEEPMKDKVEVIVDTEQTTMEEVD